MLDCSETIAMSALERKESRGAHFLLERPERDDENWIKHIAVQYTPGRAQAGIYARYGNPMAAPGQVVLAVSMRSPVLLFTGAAGNQAYS